ncbi:MULTISPECIES: amino acid permease [unclassified Sphingobium]|uniref:amino acid permease n=1 Tax=unclassified Sphingobium TaxID=2611147 RepID=UPI0007701DD8|nr:MULTISPECIES: amino acid permease [unclassified Sphingobium]AMK24463.1 amino acid permease-associated protein [Sphingobium sp. TKS]NML88667.1 amino acid permease [Sphingobium sp. TB-6]
MIQPATAPPSTSRTLGLAACIALVMGNMIGSGVFLLPASLAPFGWDAVAGWVFTIAGSLILAYVIARLTVLMPDAGGTAQFITRAYGPLAGFAIGWIYWISVIFTNVTIAVAATANLSSILPALNRPGMGALVSIAFLWLTTGINLIGARAAGVTQLATTAIKLIPIILVFLLLALMLGSGKAEVAPFPAQGFTSAGITASAALTLWALLGFESASVAADKVRDPARTIPRATLIGTAVTGLIYLLVCSGIALTLPAAESQSGSPFAAFVAHYWSPGPAHFIAAFATISCLGALNGWTLLQGEVPLAMARGGELPCWLAGTNRQGTPVRALLLSCVLGTLMLIANSLQGLVALFTAMALLSTSATLWLYVGCALAALRFRLVVLAALVGLAYALWTLWGAGLVPSGASFLLMAGGFPFYAWARWEAKKTA